MDRLEKEAKNPVIFKHKTESGNDPGHEIERTSATLTMKLQKTNNRHFNRHSIPELGEGHYQKGRQRGRTPHPQPKMDDAARAEFLKAKAKEVSLKGKATRKKGKGKAEATAGADEKPKDWVELDTETYELLKKANEGRDEMLIPNWNRIKNEKVKTYTTILGKPQIQSKGKITTPYPKGCDYPRLIRKCNFQMHAPAAWQETIKKELHHLCKDKKGPSPPLQIDPEAGQEERRADGLKREPVSRLKPREPKPWRWTRSRAPRSQRSRPGRRRPCTTRPKSRSSQTIAIM